MVTPTLFLFDIDGTLAWTRGAGRAACREALIEVFGMTGGIDAHHFGGKSDWRTLIDLLTPVGIDETAIAERLPAYSVALGQHITRLIPQFDVAPCPGAIDLLWRLRARTDVRLGIITGNVHTSAPVKLSAVGIDPAWFPIGAFGDDAIERDDLAQIARDRAAAHYGSPAGQIVVIGDTPADVACARAIGAVAVAVTTGYASEAELAACDPDHLLPDLTAFDPVLARLGWA